jgi:transposase
MQTSLKLKSYDVPEDPYKAKDLCHELVSDIEKTHAYYKQQIAFIKQQYKIALRQMRPAFITTETLRSLFDEAEMTMDPEVATDIVDDETPGKETKKRKKKKPAIPDHLPRTIALHDVAAEDKTCKTDGSQLSAMGFDTKLELKYTPPKFEVIEHRYPKYSCAKCKDGVTRAAPVPSLIPQSYASPELLAQIAVAKYCDHLPLYRQESIYGRDGIGLTRQVMADWMIKLGEALNPLVGLARERILESPAVSADETYVKILTKDGVRTSAQAYMWQLSRWGPRPLIIFEFDQTRKKEVANKLLGDYEGFVQIDAYAGYDILFQAGGPRIRVGCMAHVIRKFKDFLKSVDKELRVGHAAVKVIKMIKELYAIEDVCRGFTADARKAYRLEQNAEAIFDRLTQFVADERLAVSTSSPYYDALRYADNELPQIRHYLKNGLLELDNNLAENAIRPFAVGRRNWMFICSEDGAQSSANIYSLLITAKANGIEPRSYLTEVIRRLPTCVTIQDYEALLPQ